MTKRKIPKHKQTVRRGGRVLPKYCECGGLMEYAVDFGRVFSVCSKCTPVEKISISKLKAAGVSIG